jgi:hypothetical protein
MDKYHIARDSDCFSLLEPFGFYCLYFSEKVDFDDTSLTYIQECDKLILCLIKHSFHNTLSLVRNLSPTLSLSQLIVLGRGLIIYLAHTSLNCII